MRCMKAARLVAVMALLPLLAACAASTSGEDASCVGPYIDDQGADGTYEAPAATVSPGETLTLHGHWYTSTCNDTNHATAEVRPLPPVRLTLTLPGGATRDLGSMTPAGDELGFQVDVHVPSTSRAGSASVSDDRTPPAVYRFTVRAA